uniref:Alpha-1-microglobulin/bikunin n=1 Tax=Amblyomma americanum TaxID=6943 RepID=B5M726_AMBAM
MKFLAIALLWCWGGAVLEVGGEVVSTEAPNWPRIYSPDDCKTEERLVGKYCNPYHERRYFFNRTTEKCVLFIPENCKEDPDRGNNFPNRKVCMETCMERSPCLKSRWGNTNGTVDGYTYYAKSDLCAKVKYKKAAKFWPAANKFHTEKQCYDACAPEIVPNGWPGK